MADEDKRKHLNLLQAAIARMASNSFVLKGWSVTLATAMFGLSAKDSEPGLALLALLPILTFWGSTPITSATSGGSETSTRRPPPRRRPISI